MQRTQHASVSLMHVTCDLPDESCESGGEVRGGGGGAEGPGQKGELATGGGSAVTATNAAAAGQRTDPDSRPCISRHAQQGHAEGRRSCPRSAWSLPRHEKRADKHAHAEGEGQAEGVEEEVVEEGLAPGQRRGSVEEVETRALRMFAEHRATPRAPAQTRAAAVFPAANWEDSDADVPDVEREGISKGEGQAEGVEEVVVEREGISTYQQDEYACLVSNHWLYQGVHI